MLNLKFNQINDVNNVFSETSNDGGTYLPVDVFKPPKFDDPSYESLGTCQGIEELQLLLMVMLGSRDPDEIPKLD